MRNLFWMATLFAGVACGGGDPVDAGDIDPKASSQALMICPKLDGCYPAYDVDCRTRADASCYECGNKNGVRCCLDSGCTIKY